MVGERHHRLAPGILGRVRLRDPAGRPGMGGGARRLYRHLPRGRHIARLSRSAAADERGKPVPTTRVAWSAELIARSGARRRAGRRSPGLRRAATGSGESRPIRRTRTLPASQRSRSTSSCTTTRAAAARTRSWPALPKGLDDQQIIDAAAHFASGTRRSLDPTTAEVIDQDIVRLVERGDRRAAFRRAIRATASMPADPSRRRPCRTRTGNILRGSCMRSSRGRAAMISTRGCAASPQS